MPKLKKMMGDVNSPECSDLMRLMETQSQATLAAWAIDFARKNYLEIYEAQFPGDTRLSDAVAAAKQSVAGGKQKIRPILKEAAQLARDSGDNPIAQAAARAVSTACAAVLTPTNALGFLFYGAAAAAYSKAGLKQTPAVYDALASAELKKALDSLRERAVPDEQNPAKMKWYC